MALRSAIVPTGRFKRNVAPRASRWAIEPGAAKIWSDFNRADKIGDREANTRQLES
jgi:hypothetical protein